MVRAQTQRLGEFSASGIGTRSTSGRFTDNHRAGCALAAATLIQSVKSTSDLRIISSIQHSQIWPTPAVEVRHERGQIMNKQRGKAETAVAERTAAVDAVSSPLRELARLLARQAATELVAKREEDKNQ